MDSILYSAGAMRSLDSIVPIILSAGDSRRMGHPKALLPIGNETFLTRILRIVREVGLADPVIVLGRASDAIRPSIRGGSVHIEINPDTDRGQLSSIQIGILSLDATTQDCMIWPVDQPSVSLHLVRRLSQLFVQSECLIAFPKFGQRRGHPAIFHRSLFGEFLESPMAEGPKKILQRHIQDTAELVTDESAVVQDIDTPAEYEALTGETLQSALARSQSPTR